MKIVFLDAGTMGEGLSYGELETLGDITFYETTQKSERSERCQEADIIITNKVSHGKTTLKADFFW